MKIRVKYFSMLIIGILISSNTAYFSQTKIFPPPNLQSKLHNINKLRKIVTNYGTETTSQTGGWVSKTDPISFNFPAGSTQELVKAGGLWIGAVVDGDSLVTTFSDYESAQNGGRGNRYEVFPRFNDRDTIYVKSIYDDISSEASPEYFFQNNGALDERYMPKSAQDYICQYWDNVVTQDLVSQAPEALIEHVPLNARIIQRSFAYDFFLYDQILFTEYIIINEGNKTWEDFVIGQYNDVIMTPDVNVWITGDDFAKFDNNRRMISWGDMQGGPDGSMIDDTRKAYRLVGGPIDVNDESLKASFTHWIHGSDAGDDVEAYRRLSNGEIEPDMSEELPTGTSTRGLFGVGPFPDTEPGDTIRFVMATIAARGPAELIKYADAAKTLYDSDFSVPISPSPPKFKLHSGKGKTIVDWEWKADYTGTNPEEFEDKSRTDGDINDFEGYRIYRSSEGPDGPWELIAEYDIINGYGYDTGLEYQLEDEGLINGIRYWYAVTSFDRPERVSEELTIPSLESPISQSTHMVIPAIIKGDIEEDKVFVVPNPYRADVDYTQNPKWEYSTQDGRTEWFEIDRRIAFMNLPPSCVITIYTIAGYEVNKIDFEQGSGSPITYWNLLNKNNHAVASGLYYFVVKEPNGDKQIGKFVIVK